MVLLSGAAAVVVFGFWGGGRSTTLVKGETIGADEVATVRIRGRIGDFLGTNRLAIDAVEEKEEAEAEAEAGVVVLASDEGGGR